MSRRRYKRVKIRRLCNSLECGNYYITDNNKHLYCSHACLSKAHPEWLKKKAVTVTRLIGYTRF